MFSALPMSKNGWNERSMRFLLAAFPLVGAVIGFLEAAWFFLSSRLAFPGILTSSVACVLPVLVTGGIHMDGYMDVSDALSSYGDEQKRREILADPHIGAFAVIHLAVLLILNLGFVSGLSFTGRKMLLFGCSFVVSRCLSALAVVRFPLSKDTGLAHTFQGRADRKRCSYLLEAALLLTVLVMTAAGGLLFGFRCLIEAALMLIAAAALWLHLKKTASEKFGGLSGDLNGWFLQRTELWMLAVLVLAEAIPV